MRLYYDIFISTFNCAKYMPFDDKHTLIELTKELVPTICIHDIYALGFQELVPIWKGSFPDLVSNCLDELADIVLEIIHSRSSDNYSYIGSNCIGGISIMAFCRKQLNINNFMCANVSCGIFNSSLKGASAIKFNLSDINGSTETFTFISAHLAAKEGTKNLEKRIKNYDTIMSILNFNFGNLMFGHVFFCGDLNFRVNGISDPIANYNDFSIIEKLTSDHDELNISKTSGKIFSSFEESNITFPPTYKYDTGLNSTDYNLTRNPSWCDRILYKTYQDSEIIGEYSALKRSQVFRFSDHLPVKFTIKVPCSTIIDSTQLDLNSIFRPNPYLITIGKIVDLFLGYSGWFHSTYGILGDGILILFVFSMVMLV